MRRVDRRLFSESLVARRQIALTVLFGVLAAATVVAQATLLANIVVDVSAGRPFAAVRDGLLLLLAVVLLRGVLALAAETTALRAATQVKTNLRGRLIDQALRLGPQWLNARRSGELTTLATGGLDALDSYFARFLPQLALAAIVPPVVIVRVGAADWISALILVLTVPMIPIFLVLIGLQTRQRTTRQWRLLSQLGGHFLDLVEGLPTLKVFGRAKAQAAAIRRVTEEHRQATMATLRIAFLSALVLELLATIGTALVAVAVGLRLLGGSLDYGTALLVLLLAPEAYLPLRALGAQFHSSMEGAAAAADVLRVLDTDSSTPGEVVRTPPTASGSTSPLDLRRQAVRFDDVSLAYPERGAAVLQDVTVTLAPGSLTVLTGSSGSGKSSLLALLLRFTEPTSGRIQVGTQSLRDLPVADWRKQIAWVPQAPYLFAGTVLDNIRLGSPSATEGEVWDAVELAGAGDFVSRLPRALETRIGERGLRLSAGQRQRVALARAFLRDAPLLLLDEPTAHLDPISAGALRGSVERLMAGRTVLLVTHHRTWLDQADTVLSLVEGRVVPATLEVVT